MFKKIINLFQKSFYLFNKRFISLPALERFDEVRPLLTLGSALRLCSYLMLSVTLLKTFGFFYSGDDQALLVGLGHAIECIQAAPIKLPCGPGVVHFPIFQYLIGLPLKLNGLNDVDIKDIFVFVNLLFTFVSLMLFVKMGRLAAGRLGGDISLLILISGYLLYFMNSSFNEATAFSLFALLTYSIINSWKIGWISLLTFTCSVTKEIAPPFVVVFMLIAFLSPGSKNPLSRTQLISFFNNYKLPLLSVVMGIFVNFGFNYFRFGTYKNLANLDHVLFTPPEFIPKFLELLFFSPAAGLFFVWLSLTLITIVPIFLSGISGGRRLIIFALLALLILINLGLSRWYSPFGMIAWGPRLTLPFLGSIAINLLYLSLPAIIHFFSNLGKLVTLVIIFILVSISSTPNLAFRLDRDEFYGRILYPTRVEMGSGVKNFTVQTAPGMSYFEASVEAYSRNVLVDASIRTVKKHAGIFGIWYLAIFLLCLSSVYISENKVNVRRDRFGVV